MTHLTLGSAVFSWLKENVVDMGLLVTWGQGKQCACRWPKSELSDIPELRGLVGLWVPLWVPYERLWVPSRLWFFWGHIWFCYQEGFIFLFCVSMPLDPSRSLDRSLFVTGRLWERHPLGEGTLYHQRGAMPLHRAQPVQQSVQCVEDISAA